MRPLQRPAIPVWYALLTRTLFALFCLLTSIYCLLAYIPDTYFAFIQAPFQFWMIEFIRLHAYLFCGVLAGLAVALWMEYASSTARRITLEFVGFHVAAAIYFLLKQPISHVSNNSLSFIWSLAFLFPVIWLGIVDEIGKCRRTETKAFRLQIPLHVGLLAGLCMGFITPASSWLRNTLGGRQFPLDHDDLLAWTYSLVAHGLFGICVACVVNLAGMLAARLKGRLSSLIYGAMVSAAVALIFKKVLLISIPFVGLEANVYSVMIAVALVSFGAGLHISKSNAPVPVAPKSWKEAPATQNVALMLVLLAATYTVPAVIGVMDWNSIIAKLWSIIMWSAIFALLLRMRDGKTAQYPPWLLVCLGVMTFGAYYFSQTDTGYGARVWNSKPGLRSAVSRHVNLDASFAAVKNLWAVSQEKPCDALCRFLKEQTGIPASVAVQPVDVKLVDELRATAQSKPNVFVIVVDSLRRDYVSAYNPAVQFTPEIQKFANESVVMRNSFTRYAGTTLSEPAIWAGSLMLHKHYVRPFHPMNNLEKLMQTDGYDRFLTVDTVLRLLLDPALPVHRLDANMTNWSEQDLCTTATDAERQINTRSDKSKPIFLYTQPQNIHVVSLEHARHVRPPLEGTYPGFQPSAATEIKRLDGCFGSFVSYLKARGVYDNSIVVLTADHGESYGDYGHTNHTFGLHPEVLRVPLIIHLPVSMQNKYYVDPDAVAFNIDVTPSLYYLLGHRPVANDQRFGRPLFTLTKQENESYQRKDYLVAVCYGPIYGLLSHKGDNLFVANEMDDVYQYFDLAHDPGGTHNLLDAQILASDQKLIRADVQGIADLYHYQHHSQSLLSWMMR
jgi:arylsulfatase A-like enzyme